MDGLSLFTGLSQLAASSQIEAFNLPVVTRTKRRQNDMTGKEKNRRHSTYINTSAHLDKESGERKRRRHSDINSRQNRSQSHERSRCCLLYTSDAADE